MSEDSIPEDEYLALVKEGLLTRIRTEDALNRSSQLLMTNFYVNRDGEKLKPAKPVINRALKELEAQGFIRSNVEFVSQAGKEKWKDVVFESVNDPDKNTRAHEVKHKNELLDQVEHQRDKAYKAAAKVAIGEFNVDDLQRLANDLGIESGQRVNERLLQPYIDTRFTNDKDSFEKGNALRSVVTEILQNAHSRGMAGILTTHLGFGPQAARICAGQYIEKINSVIDRYMWELPWEAIQMISEVPNPQDSRRFGVKVYSSNSTSSSKIDL